MDLSMLLVLLMTYLAHGLRIQSQVFPHVTANFGPQEYNITAELVVSESLICDESTTENYGGTGVHF